MLSASGHFHTPRGGPICTLVRYTTKPHNISLPLNSFYPCDKISTLYSLMLDLSHIPDIFITLQHMIIICFISHFSKTNNNHSTCFAL